MKRECAVTILAQNAKQDTPLSHSKQVPCDKEAPRLVSRRPACGNGAHAPAITYAPAPHDPRLRPIAALAESRGPLSQNSCQPEGLQPESAAHRSVEQGSAQRRAGFPLAGCDRGADHERVASDPCASAGSDPQ